MRTNVFIEPAENENSFLIHFLKAYSFFNLPGDSTLIDNGIFSIYPSLFHQVAAMLPLSALASGRLLSIICYVILSTGLFIWSYKKNRDPVFSVLIGLAVIGSAPVFSYFFMSRVDSLFISAGILSILAADSAKSGKRPSLAAIAGLLSATSFLTKQTAIVFPLLALLSVLSGRLYKRNIIVFSVAFLIFTSFYILLIDRDFFTKYRNGIELFGIGYTLSSLYEHVKHLIFNYWYLIAATLVLVVKRKEHIFSLDLVQFGLLLLVSLKLWGNGAAFHNNFFLINFGFIYLIVRRINSDRNLTTKLAALFCVGLGVGLLFRINTFNIIDLTRRLESPAPSVILEYVHSNPGPYLTSRADYYVFDEKGSVPVFEGSVGIGIYGSLNDIQHRPKEANAYRKLVTETKTKLQRQEIKGVILGINGDAMKTMFPEIQQHYKMIAKEEAVNGIFDITMSLYVPKDKYE